MKRKVKITFEIEELAFFNIRKSLTGFCGFCGQSVEILSLDNDVLFLNLSENVFFQLMQSGNVHFIESDKIYLCRNSLEMWMKSLSSDVNKEKEF